MPVAEHKSEPVVEVTLREVYDDTTRRLTVVEEWMRDTSGKLDVLLERTSNQQGVGADHEERLRSVERWKWVLPPGAIGAIGALILQLMDSPFGG